MNITETPVKDVLASFVESAEKSGVKIVRLKLQRLQLKALCRDAGFLCSHAESISFMGIPITLTD